MLCSLILHEVFAPMPKRRLMTPGPTQVPESARLILAKQVIHHRTPEFRRLFAEVLSRLKQVFCTSHDVVVLTSSGTGGMEAAVANVVPRGGKAIVLESGKFSERWRKIAEAFGIEVVKVEVPWGELFRPEQVAEALARHPDTVAVYGTLMESSTGVGHDIRGIAEVVRQTPSLLVVDGISGAGVMECRVDDWGIDILVVGSQKALMLPPGLAFLTVSPRAWKQIEQVPAPAFYFNLKAYRKALAEEDTPWTSAHTLIAAANDTLRQLVDEGMENVWRRAAILARACQAGVTAMGLDLYAQRPAEGLTAARMPPGLNAGVVIRRLESRFGITLAGGQGEAAGKIVRIAHLGLIDEVDILGTLAALELVLHELGQPVELGSAVTAAARVLAESPGVARGAEAAAAR